MSTSLESQKLPETPEQSQFLLSIPDTLTSEEVRRRLYIIANDTHVLDFQWNAAASAAVKQVLELDQRPYNLDEAVVILNAILESQQLCGYNCPDLITQNIFKRRETAKLLVQSADQ